MSRGTRRCRRPREPRKIRCRAGRYHEAGERLASGRHRPAAHPRRPGDHGARRELDAHHHRGDALAGGRDLARAGPSPSVPGARAAAPGRGRASPVAAAAAACPGTPVARDAARRALAAARPRSATSGRRGRCAGHSRELGRPGGSPSGGTLRWGVSAEQAVGRARRGADRVAAARASAAIGDRGLGPKEARDLSALAGVAGGVVKKGGHSDGPREFPRKARREPFEEVPWA